MSGGDARPPSNVLAYLGPPGTYSHQVALSLRDDDDGGPVPGSTRLIACPTITATLAAASEAALQALLPFENSTFGRVKETCGLLGISEDDVVVGDEYKVPSGRIRVVKKVVHSIEHSLLVSEDTWRSLGGLEEDALPLEALCAIEQVRSHEQALGQCSLFLSKYLPKTATQPDGQLPTSSTAAAAASLLTSSGQGRMTAAIASSICATHNIYPGLRLARKDIQDRSDNRTTFLLVENVRR